jgi:hypothetical protein
MASIQTAAGGNAEGVVKESNFVKNRWYHYCSVYDGSATGNTERLKIFIDGVQKSLIYDATVPSTPYTVSSSLALGYPPPAYPYFNGKISNLQIYNKALSASEIQQNYNATKNRFINALPPVRNGLVLELDAGQRASYPGTDSTWYDLSGNSLNGTLTNGPTFLGIGATSSIVFDGSNDYISVPTTLSVNASEFSYEVLFKITTAADGNTLLSLNYNYPSSGYLVRQTTGNYLIIYSDNGTETSLSSNSALSNNTIYHIVIVQNNNNCSIYINGILEDYTLFIHTFNHTLFDNII